MKLEKRISELETGTPKEVVMNGLGELHAWESTPEGKAELNELYNPDRNETK